LGSKLFFASGLLSKKQIYSIARLTSEAECGYPRLCQRLEAFPTFGAGQWLA